MISDAIDEAIDDYSPERVKHAIKESALNNKRNWKYVEAILRRWKAEGFQSKTSKPSNNGYKRTGLADYPAHVPPSKEEVDAMAAELRKGRNNGT